MSLTVAVGLSAAAALWTGEWLAGLSVATLAFAFTLLRPAAGPPVLFLAVAFQWMQVTVGLFYHGLTGRSLTAIETSDYRPMVIIGLASVAALAVGLRVGLDLVRRRWPEHHLDMPVVSFQALLVAYGASFVGTGVLQQLAWQYPLFTQAILAATFVRLAVFYLLLRRVVLPRVRWGWVGAILGLELAMGLTGYFAGFREPLVLAAVAMAEVFQPRRVQHWAFAAMVAAVLAGAALFWMGVRTDLRQDFAEVAMFAESRSLRLNRMHELFTEWRRSVTDSQEVWWNVDFLVERVWVIYYPALALARVPHVLPHTDGAIIGGALRHIATPRLLFPDKPELASDSEMVRRYSGVWVAGPEHDTSIAFGYAAEAYVDFGVPLMFLPVLVWAVFLGCAYQTCLSALRHREIAIPLVAVIFWLSVYLFERSFVKWMGLTGTLLIYLGGLAFLVDRCLVHADADRVARTRTADAPEPGRASATSGAAPS